MTVLSQYKSRLTKKYRIAYDYHQSNGAKSQNIDGLRGLAIS